MPPAADLARLDGFRLPEDFSFGVATAGFQVEGGFNGPGEPRNNWYDWEVEGRVEPSGIANDSWHRYDDDFAATEAMGCDAYCLSIEWARVQPTFDGTDDEPPVDEAAVHHYAAMVAAARRRRVEPYVTLHHFTHPRWLGLDLWLRSESPGLFARWATEIVRRLNRALVEAGGSPCTRYVTLNEINIVALNTWWDGAFPGGGLFGAGRTRRALDHLLAAHVGAYGAIHDVHEAEGWPAPMVSTPNFAFATWETDRGLTDLLLARRRGVARDDLAAYLTECRRRWYDALARLPHPGWTPGERALGWLTGRVLPLDLPAATEAIYASSRDDALDAVGTDIYAPWSSGRFRLPGHRTAGGRTPKPWRQLWDDPPMPAVLANFSRLHAGDDGLPVWILENGLCNRVRRGVSYPRLDGWTRVRYLREHLAQLALVVASGVDVSVYLHWCLFDNYEWGSYEPRFGLHGVDRERGVRRLAHDSMGGDAARTYRRIIESLRSGDELAAALSA
ncbi:MAG: family 1 glycosylhydrolase [Acidimicrobiales bacterium]